MMKKLLLVLLLCPVLLSAQTFTNSTWTPIPNNDSDIYIPINVSGLPSSIDSSFGVVSVCLDITHTFVSQLVVKLQSPNGEIIVLADQKGGSGSGYLNTCFQENATHGYVNNGVAPFVGSYFPQQSLNAFNDSQNPNGTWNLILRDVFTPTDTGSFHDVSITFGFNPPSNPTTAGPCSNSNAGGCQCPDGISSNCDLLPDMTASALIIQNSKTEYPGHITLGNATPNIGWGPLEIHGIQSCFCDTVPVSCTTTACPGSGLPPKQLLNQRIYHRNGNVMTHYDRPAGTMSYHQGHSHVHVDDWAFFTLRVATPNPDARTWPIIGTGTKQSFCLVNLGDCDSDPGYCVDAAGNVLFKADIPNSDFGVVSGCSIDQGIYVGNLDIYSAGLNGMGIMLPQDICNEHYYIVSVTDFNNNFLESNDDNNWVKVPITLSQQSSNDHFRDPGFIYTLAGMRVDVLANALNPDSMVWVWGDGTSSTITGIGSPLTYHIYSSPGTYVVYSYAYNHCGPSVDADTISIIPTGLNAAIETVVSFKAYPNPSKGNSWLSYTLINKTNVQLEVFDEVGKRIKTIVNDEQLQGKYRYEFNPIAENLPAGIYFARLTTDDKTLNIRMVVIQ